MNQEIQTPQEQALWTALKEVMDPEVGINIVDMGMVYTVKVIDNKAKVEITMTSPSCPLHVSITSDARHSIIRNIPSLEEVEVQVVWDPPWNPELMSNEAKNILGHG